MNSVTEITPEHDDVNRRRPGTRFEALGAEAPLSVLSRKVERTYLTRLQMARRLQNRGSNWNSALVSLTVSSAIASTCLLIDGSLYGTRGSVLLVVLGIFILAASLMVANTDYANKSRHAFEIYRDIQRLSVKVDALSQNPPGRASKIWSIRNALDGEYQDVLDRSDNHAPADYAKAVRTRLLSHRPTD